MICRASVFCRVAVSLVILPPHTLPWPSALLRDYQMQHPLIRSFCVCSIISARQCLPEGREEILVPIVAPTWVTRTWWVGSRTAQQLSTLSWHSNSSSHQLEDKWQVSLSPSPCFINEQQTPLSVSSFKWCGYQWHSVLLCPPHSDRPNTLSISQHCSYLRDSLVRMLKPGVLVASWPSFSQAHVKTAQRNGQKSSREAFRLHSLTGVWLSSQGREHGPHWVVAVHHVPHVLLANHNLRQLKEASLGS